MTDFKEYQKMIADHAIYPNVGSNFVYPVLGLAEEAGEVVGKIKKVLRDDGGIISEEKKQEIKKELGDVLWYIAAECNELGLDLAEVMDDNILKMFGRRERGTLHGSGDNR
jgi:NTP pyrophosphatase (non-canonical NTP hydrolase)